MECTLIKSMSSLYLGGKISDGRSRIKDIQYRTGKALGCAGLTQHLEIKMNQQLKQSKTVERSNPVNITEWCKDMGTKENRLKLVADLRDDVPSQDLWNHSNG